MAEGGQRFPDIEIYVRDLEPDRLADWLTGAVAGSELAPAARGSWQWRTATATIPILVVTGVAGRYTSLWFRSARTPWTDDLSCARSASEALGREVRCSAGGWQEGDGGDGWWSVESGTERRIRWEGGP
jgi:hypothetical protein